MCCGKGGTGRGRTGRRGSLGRVRVGIGGLGECRVIMGIIGNIVCKMGSSIRLRGGVLLLLLIIMEICI